MLTLAILAGGYATRLGSLATEIPKCLFQINRRPFVDWQLDVLVQNGYTNFVFCVSHKSEMIQEYLGDGSERGISIKYSLDGPIQLGTGGAIQKALPLLGDAFGVVYGDSYLPINYSKVEQHFLSTGAQALMTVYENKNHFDKSNVEFVNGKLINYEKGASSTSMHHIDYGITFFRKGVFHPWLSKPSFDLSEVCHQLATRGELLGYEVYERFYEIGSVPGIDEFSQYLKEAFNEL